MTAILIDRTTGTNIGDMTTSGGLAAAFDGVTSQISTQCASRTDSATGRFVGKTLVSAKKFNKLIAYGSSNQGFNSSVAVTVVLSAYGKSGTAPGSATNGTLLGTSSFTDPDNSTAQTINSTDLISTWDHLWVVVYCGNANTDRIAELELYEEAGTGYTLSCDTIGFSELGISTGLSITLPGAARTYALSGIAAALTKSVTRLVATPIAYTLSGFSVGLSTTDALTIVAGPVAFAVSSTSAAFSATRVISGSVASYTLTGNNVNFLSTYKLSASVSAFVITGNSGIFTIDVNNNRIYVKYLGVWKQPEPYVKYQDSWVIPEVYVKHDSVWKLVYEG